MNAKVGDRVGVVLGTEGKVMEFVGYGVYEGYQPVDDDAVGFFAEAHQELQREDPKFMDPKYGNPRIKLDSGETVYGCETWWGSEAAVKKMVEEFAAKGGTVVNVTVAEFRRKFREEVKAKEAKKS